MHARALRNPPARHDTPLFCTCAHHASAAACFDACKGTTQSSCTTRHNPAVGCSCPASPGDPQSLLPHSRCHTAMLAALTIPHHPACSLSHLGLERAHLVRDLHPSMASEWLRPGSTRVYSTHQSHTQLANTPHHPSMHVGCCRCHSQPDASQSSRPQSASARSSTVFFHIP